MPRIKFVYTQVINTIPGVMCMLPASLTGASVLAGVQMVPAGRTGQRPGDPGHGVPSGAQTSAATST